MVDIFVILFGLIIGSFVAAYSYRYPLGIKISNGFSFCDKCKRKILWYENIPVLSYIFLRGKCRTCKNKISIRYPLIEISSAIFFLLLFKYNSGLISFNLIPLFAYYFICSLIFIIDIENQIIPDDFVFSGIVIVLVHLLLFSGNLLFSSIFSGFICASFLVLIFLITKGKGMGLGDVKFAVFGGMLVGVSNSFVWMLLAFLTGAVTGIILILLGNAKLKDKIAFGPFLIIAIPLAHVWGVNIMSIITK